MLKENVFITTIRWYLLCIFWAFSVDCKWKDEQKWNHRLLHTKASNDVLAQHSLQKEDHASFQIKYRKCKALTIYMLPYIQIRKATYPTDFYVYCEHFAFACKYTILYPVRDLLCSYMDAIWMHSKAFIYDDSQTVCCVIFLYKRNCQQTNKYALIRRIPYVNQSEN